MIGSLERHIPQTDVIEFKGQPHGVRGSTTNCAYNMITSHDAEEIVVYIDEYMGRLQVAEHRASTLDPHDEPAMAIAYSFERTGSTIFPLAMSSFARSRKNRLSSFPLGFLGDRRAHV